MSELHEKKVRYIFQDIVTTCQRCRRDGISVISTDQEPGLLVARHFIEVDPRVTWRMCDGSLAEYERPRQDKKPKKTGTHGR